MQMLTIYKIVCAVFLCCMISLLMVIKVTYFSRIAASENMFLVFQGYNLLIKNNFSESTVLR